MRNKFFNAGLALILVFIMVISASSILTYVNMADDGLQMYEKTTFDLVITAPSREQVAVFSDEYETVSPAYHSEVYEIESGTYDVPILFFENDTDRLNTFFNDELLLDGIYDGGIVIDQTLSSSLQKTIGDILEFEVLGIPFEVEITGIIPSVTYLNFTNGLGCITLTAEQLEIFSENDYQVAFITVAEEQKLGDTDAEIIASIRSEFEDYIPYGKLESEESFIETYKLTTAKPSTMSEAEWLARLANSYDEHVENFESANYSDSVQIKLEIGENTIAKYTYYREKATSNILVYSIIIVLLIILAQSLIYYLNRENVLEKLNDQNQSVSSVLIDGLLTYIVMTAVTIFTSNLFINIAWSDFGKETLRQVTVPYNWCVLISMAVVSIGYCLLWYIGYERSSNSYR